MMVDGQKQNMPRWSAEQAQSFNNRDIDRLRRWELEDAMQREHEAHEKCSRNGRGELKPENLSDHRDIPPGPPPAGTSSMRVHFLMSMQHFVKVIPLWLHIHNQSSRRLHRLWEGRCHQASIQTRNLQGLVLQCSLHHQRHHVQMQLKA